MSPNFVSLTATVVQCLDKSKEQPCTYLCLAQPIEGSQHLVYHKVFAYQHMAKALLNTPVDQTITVMGQLKYLVKPNALPHEHPMAYIHLEHFYLHADTQQAGHSVQNIPTINLDPAPKEPTPTATSLSPAPVSLSPAPVSLSPAPVHVQAQSKPLTPQPLLKAPSCIKEEFDYAMQACAPKSKQPVLVQEIPDAIIPF